MVEERVLRRRSAILAASVAGDERLMGEDVDRTRAILKGYHIELIAPSYQGSLWVFISAPWYNGWTEP